MIIYGLIVLSISHVYSWKELVLCLYVLTAITGGRMRNVGKQQGCSMSILTIQIATPSVHKYKDVLGISI